MIFKSFGLVFLLVSLVACQQGAPVSVGQDNPRDSMASRALGQATQEDAQMDAKENLAGWASYVSYASVTMPNGQRCNAGILTDEDGMEQRPAVELVDARGVALWRSGIALPMDTCQARATHCVASGSDLFVLVQADTQSVQSLSQTVLEVVRLNGADGKVISRHPAVVPDVQDAYSAWVGKEPSNVVMTADDVIQISGHYKLMDAPEPTRQFVAHVQLIVNH